MRLVAALGLLVTALVTPRQMIRFGELHENEGQAGGRRLLPPSWVAHSIVPRGRSRRRDHLGAIYDLVEQQMIPAFGKLK